MARELELEERVFLLCAGPDVMDHEGHAAGVAAVGDEHDMGAIAGDQAGDDVAGLEGGGLGGKREHPALAFEIGLQVGHATMVDIAVGALEPPALRVEAEVRPHVLVDESLEIERVRGAKGADHHVGADPGFRRHVASRIIELPVGGIVAGGLAHLGSRGRDERRIGGESGDGESAEGKNGGEGETGEAHAVDDSGVGRGP